MNPRINLDNLVRQLVPIHKRQPVRLSLLRGMLRPLRELLEEFDTWRSHTRMMVNVNSQVMILERYLRRKYGSSDISILNFKDNLLAICLEAEGETLMPPIGFVDEKTVDIPLYDEMEAIFSGCDFLVYVPGKLGQEQIQAIQSEIETYKQVLITYKIIQI